MKKKTLDLSKALMPLSDELKPTLETLCPKKEDPSLFGQAIDTFILKYSTGGMSFDSLDDLLSATTPTDSSYLVKDAMPLGALIDDLMPIKK